jgi:hypothetical protein
MVGDGEERMLHGVIGGQMAGGMIDITGDRYLPLSDRIQDV